MHQTMITLNYVFSDSKVLTSVHGSENIDNVDEADHVTILNILLQNPEELNLKEKPSAIRQNKMFTLDSREIPIASAKADDNGAYNNNGSATKFYRYNEEGSRTAHKNENNVWYINVRSSKSYSKVLVPEKEIYQLKREYCISKSNPKFSRTIVTVKAVNEKEIKPFYLVIYKWSGEGPCEFHVPQHGNATRPSSSQYYRKDPSLFEEVDDMLKSGLSTEQIYSSTVRKEPATVSETVSGPKLINNRKQSMKKNESSCSSGGINNNVLSEAEAMISSLKSNPVLQSVTFTKENYSTFNSLPNMTNDLYRFCVVGNSILRVDTTFELVDGLWLTDTTYANEALLDTNNKHPEFPGPSFWHFRKTRECYRRFAGEIIVNKPELLGIKKVGHDMDKALSQGLCDVFRDAKKLWCTQHMQERDAHKLKTIGCNQRTQTRVMADIYGAQGDVLLQNGLADAEDENDFDVKLASLKPVWDEIAPGFHQWFKNHRSKMFKDCLVLSARENLGINGRFYTNGLELKHKLQKKNMREEDVPKEVAAVTLQLYRLYSYIYDHFCDVSY
jgi:hypothetical protein